MDMVKMGTITNQGGQAYDYYRGFDEDNWALVHNLVLAGSPAPHGGYYNQAYIRELKGFKDTK